MELRWHIERWARYGISLLEYGCQMLKYSSLAYSLPFARNNLGTLCEMWNKLHCKWKEMMIPQNGKKKITIVMTSSFLITFTACRKIFGWMFGWISARIVYIFSVWDIKPHTPTQYTKLKQLWGKSMDVCKLWWIQCLASGNRAIMIRPLSFIKHNAMGKRKEAERERAPVHLYKSGIFLQRILPENSRFLFSSNSLSLSHSVVHLVICSSGAGYKIPTNIYTYLSIAYIYVECLPKVQNLLAYKIFGFLHLVGFLMK